MTVVELGPRRSSSRGAPPASAWAESPQQLLGIIEAASAGWLGRRLTVGPRAEMPGMFATLGRLRSLALPSGVTIVEPAAGPPNVNGRTWVVGDLLSGQVQQRLLLARPTSLTLVSEGLATGHALRALAGGEPMLRVDRTSPGVRRALARATTTRLLGLADQRRLQVVTAVPLPDDLVRALTARGVRVWRHQFGWLRGQAVRQAGAKRLVLGSALAVDGLVRPEHYLAWVRSRCRVAVAGVADGTPVTYWAHRREDSATLGPVAAMPGVRVQAAGIPVGLGVLGLGAGSHVATLASPVVSSAVASLTQVLAGSGATMSATPVPDDWWLPGVPPALRESATGS